MEEVPGSDDMVLYLRNDLPVYASAVGARQRECKCFNKLAWKTETRCGQQ